MVAETNANYIFYLGKEGQIICDKFVMERIEGDKSVWSPIKLRRLNTFNTNAKTFSITVQNKVVLLKEDKSLFQSFLVVSQKRKETDLPFVVGNYELTVSHFSVLMAILYHV